MITIYNRLTELVAVAAVESGDVLIDGRGAEWFTVNTIRESGHKPRHGRRIVLSGLNAQGLAFSHSAVSTSLVRRVVRDNPEAIETAREMHRVANIQHAIDTSRHLRKR